MAVTQINLKNGLGADNNNNTTNNTSQNTIDSSTHSNNSNSSNTHTTSNDNNNNNNSDSSVVVFSVPSFNEFITDFNIIRKCVYSGPVTSYRLVYISVFSS